VSNAACHADSAQVTVRLFKTTRRVRLEVADDDPVQPQARSTEWDAESGRGLWLIANMAVRWGVDPERRGKRIWVELPLDG